MKSNIPVQTEQSRLTVQAEVLYFALPVLRAHRSLTIIPNTREHCGKSRPLNNQSERAKYLLFPAKRYQRTSFQVYNLC